MKKPETALYHPLGNFEKLCFMLKMFFFALI